MKYVKSYYVATEGSGRISPPRGATAFAVFLEDQGWGKPLLIRICMAIDDELETEHRDVWVLQDEQPFEPKGPVKYVGSVRHTDVYAEGQQVNQTLFHVMISVPAQPQPQQRAQRVVDLPPELQAQLRSVVEEANAKAAAMQAKYEQPPTSSDPSAG